ncbi:class-II fumarase/aspartase family protein [Nocardia amamiensis]|uniref:class-II fumarase/aspartase family protein n=1 Tax=Nocardia TaxID=1817 RepID=UPI0033D6A1F9
MTVLVDDDAWIKAMLDVEIALARAQSRLGVIPESAADDITRAARSHRFDTEDLAVASRGAANPVVPLVAELTRAVTDIDATSANYVHRGATSQDILDTAAMLVTSRALAAIVGNLERIALALARLARRHRETPIAARTLGMHAVPTTFGAKTAGWLNAVLDAHERLVPLARGGLPIQLGGAAGTLAAYLECARETTTTAGDKSRRELAECLANELAAQLSLAPTLVPWQTNRTPIIDVAGALAVASGALGKMAIDVMDLSRTELAEVREPAAEGRGESSAMPQKRNPTLSTLIRTSALQVPALISTLHLAMLAEHERPAGAWHSEWQPLRECLLLVGGATATAVELVEGLEVDSARMLDNLNLTNGQIVSERLSAVLAPLLGKTMAKKTLQSASFRAEQTRRPLADVLAADTAIRARLSPADIAELLTPANYLGAAPDIVDFVLARCTKNGIYPGRDALDRDASSLT